MSKKTITIYNRERVPVNKQSAIVTAPAEKHYYEIPVSKLNQKIWEVPPPMYDKPPKIFKGKNLIGTRRGQIEIIGYYGKNATLKTSQWVARCDCGYYELRNGKSWRKGLKKGTSDCCCRCDYINLMREGKQLK